MKGTRKIVSAIIAFLMIFSFASVLAFADWNPASVDDAPKTLTVKTEFYKNRDGAWVPAEGRVVPGETLKARVKVGSDFYAADGNILFFYNSDFFECDYAPSEDPGVLNKYDLALNPDNPNYDGLSAAKLLPLDRETVVARQQNLQQYDDAAYGAFTVEIRKNATGLNVQYDDTDWLFEIQLKVKSLSDLEAAGVFSGELLVPEETVRSASNEFGFTNFPKGPSPEDGFSIENVDMSNWNPISDLKGDEVSIKNKIFFYKAFTFPSQQVYNTYEGYNGVEIPWDNAELIPDPVPDPDARPGSTFKGWVYQSDLPPAPAPSTPRPADLDVMPESKDGVELYAYWLQHINLTFDENGGTRAPDFDAALYEDVEPGAEWPEADRSLIEPGGANAPAKDGYIFMGWSTQADPPVGEEDPLPDVYPATAATYTAVWARRASIEYRYIDEHGVDTLIRKDEGPAGRPLSEHATPEDAATAPDRPEIVGKRDMGWSQTPPPDEPNADDKIFPLTDDLIIYAQYADKVYHVIYKLEIPNTSPQAYEAMGSCGVEYNEPIPALPWDYQVPTGYEDPADPYYIDADDQQQPFNAGNTAAQFPDGALMNDRADALIIYYPALTPETCDAVFDPAGGIFPGETVSEPKTVPTAYEAAIQAPDDPAKDDYVFLGWTPDVGYMDDANGKTFTAVYKPKRYTATYLEKYDDDPDTGYYDKISGDFGDTFDAPADPVKVGYDFEGWALNEPPFTNDPAAGDVIELPATVPSGDHVYLAVFTPVKRGLTFDLNYPGAAPPSTAEVDFDSPIISPSPNPERAGYTFAGWSETADGDPIAGSNAAGASLGIMDDVNGKTFYAIWTPGVSTSFTVQIYRVDYQNGSVEDPPETPGATISYNNGTTDNTVEFVDSVPTPPEAGAYYIVKNALETAAAEQNGEFADYEFDVQTSNGGEPQTITGDGNAVITVQFKPKEYPVAFYANSDGGNDPDAGRFNEADSPTLKTVLAAFGSPISAPASPPVRDGYIFAGWQREGGASSELGSVSSGGDNIYAQWNAATETPFAVNVFKMDAEGGYGDAPDETITDNAGTTDELIRNYFEYDPGVGFIYDDETLDANTNDPLNAPFEAATIGGDGLTSVNVYYKRVKITATFDANGGEFGDVSQATKTVEALYGAAVLAPGPDPDRANYRFDGWFDASDPDENALTPAPAAGSFVANAPASDVTYKAKWNPGLTIYTVICVDENDDEIARDEENYSGTTDSYITSVDKSQIEADNPVLTEDYDFVRCEATDQNPVPLTPPDKSTTIRLYYSLKTCSVVFDAGENGQFPGVGTQTYEVAVKYGAPITMPAAPIKEHYDFTGWIRTAVPPETEPVFYPKNAPDLGTARHIQTETITAEYDKISYEIRFNGNGGKFEPDDSSYTAFIPYDDPIALPADAPALAHEGYELSGWSSDPNATAAENLKVSGLPGVQDVYAVWAPEARSYIVEKYMQTLVPDYSGLPFQTETGNAVVGERIIIQESDPLCVPPEGFELDVAASVLSGDIPAAADESLVLKICFKRKTYNITINGVSGSYMFGETVECAAEPPENESLAGWVRRDSLSGTGTAFPLDENNTFTVTDDMVGDNSNNDNPDLFVYIDPVFAAAQCDIIFKDYEDFANGPHAGRPTRRVECDPVLAPVPCGGAIPRVPLSIADPANPNKDDDMVKGYTFVGWFENEQTGPNHDPETSGAQCVAGTTAAPAETSRTYYAHYTRIPVKLMPKWNDDPAKRKKTVIERRYSQSQGGGVFKETYNNPDEYPGFGFEPADPARTYDTPADYKRWYVYGLKKRMKAADYDSYVEVQGSGSYALTPSVEGNGTGYGTGTKITVTDDVTGLVVEEFYVVIYGDLDGDALIDQDDADILRKELRSTAWSRRSTRVWYKFTAANLDEDKTTLDYDDQDAMKKTLRNQRGLSQITGIYG